jgi:cytochrome c oxidase accessory protein FixG
LQGVLLDNQSVVVAYDYKRGEKEQGRAKFKKNEDRASTGKGDCIDCKLCVHVCPTGIDIRNGTQLECVNCTACIDECDHMMEKVGLPTGLIRYASIDNIEKKSKFRLTARMKGYSAVLGILVMVLIGMIFLRNDVEATILRLPGQLYEKMENGNISNVYTYKLINKTTEDIEDVNYKLLSHDGSIELVTHSSFVIPRQGLAEGTLFIQLPTKELNKDRVKLEIGVYSGDELIETATANFLGPRSYR